VPYCPMCSCSNPKYNPATEMPPELVQAHNNRADADLLVALSAVLRRPRP